MSTTKHGHRKTRLPRRYSDLVRELPPQAIMDEVHYENTLETIDRIMAGGSLTRDQSLYLETLVQLVQAYEASHHAIDTSGITSLDTLRHLMDQSEMNASDLARLLGVHLSMGSKILKGERSLTTSHVKKLSAHFRVSTSVFID